MEAQDLLNSAEPRILEHRTRIIDLTVQDTTGQPLANIALEIRQTAHRFKFGCNAFLIDALDDVDLQRAYEERFAALLNYATLPFYWGGYERSEGMTQETHLRRMAEWAQTHGIQTKGHPLVWHEVFPPWAHAYPDAEVLHRLEERVRGIVDRFRNSVQIWDVVNEATVSHRFDNAVGRWMAREGAPVCVAQAFQWAHESNPEAELCYNDFNVSEEAQQFVADLLDRGAPVDILGIQSHMHKSHWPLERAWQVCESYARFGLPLHWTELTVLSGRLKAPEDNDWHRRHTDWHTTAEGEQAQAEYVEQLYTLLFSHPAVGAITWWDFSDRGAWQAAPAGLVREDMSPKPLYERLYQRIHHDWWTHERVRTDSQGKVQVRCFLGEYELTAIPETREAICHHVKVDRDTEQVTLRLA